MPRSWVHNNFPHKKKSYESLKKSYWNYRTTLIVQCNWVILEKENHTGLGNVKTRIGTCVIQLCRIHTTHRCIEKAQNRKEQKENRNRKSLGESLPVFWNFCLFFCIGIFLSWVTASFKHWGKVCTWHMSNFSWFNAYILIRTLKCILFMFSVF